MSRSPRAGGACPGRFEQVIANDASGDACFGLAVASWWLGDNRSASTTAARAYALFRRSADVERGRAVCGVAGDHLQGELRQLRGRQRLDRPRRAAARARSSPGRCTAGCGSRAPTGRPISTRREALTVRAVDVARAAGDVDLELVALSQLGLIRVGQGRDRRRVRADRRGDGRRAGRGAVEPRHGRLHVLRHAERLRAGE